MSEQKSRIIFMDGYNQVINEKTRDLIFDIEEIYHHVVDNVVNIFNLDQNLNDVDSYLLNEEDCSQYEREYVIDKLSNYISSLKEIKRETMNTNGYSIFLMVELARCFGLIEPKLEYDRTWEMGKDLYEQFEDSKFNDENESEYQCIHNFLENGLWLDIDDQKPSQGQAIYYQGNHGKVKATYIAENVARCEDGIRVDLFQLWQPLVHASQAIELVKLKNRYRKGDLVGAKLKVVKEIKKLTGWGLKQSKKYFEDNIDIFPK